MGPGLDAQTFNHALRQGIQGQAAKEAHRSLEQGLLPQILEILLEQTSVLGAQTSALHQVLDRADEGRAVEGLEQIVARTELHRVDGGLHIDDTGHHDNVLLGVAFLDAVDQIAAVHAGHHEIREDDVESRLLEDSDRLLAAARGLRLPTFLGQQILDQFAKVSLVVDREDSPFRHAPPRTLAAGEAQPVRATTRIRSDTSLRIESYAPGMAFRQWCRSYPWGSSGAAPILTDSPDAITAGGSGPTGISPIKECGVASTIRTCTSVPGGGVGRGPAATFTIRW